MCCCVKFVMIIIKMIKIWLKEDFYVMVLYFDIVEEYAVYKVHGTSLCWSCLRLWLFTLVAVYACGCLPVFVIISCEYLLHVL
jgi:hypothetical protein